MFVLLFSLLAKMVMHREQKNNIPIIIMPFVKRHPNTINNALISVERSRGEMPVMLINGSPNHKLDGWCNWFQCMDSPPLPQNILARAIALDKRGDTEQYITWRTNEAWDALFALKSFLKTKRKWLIFLQDDVEVIDLYNIPDNDATCLRVGNDYCGMVAYKLKRWVVEEFAKRIEDHIIDTPIDWILDQMRHELDITLHRLGKVKHKGKISSNKQRRIVDGV